LTAKIVVERGKFDADFSNLAKTGGRLCLPLNLTRKSGRLAFRRSNFGRENVKFKEDLACKKRKTV